MKPRFCASWGSLAVLLSLVFVTSEDFACSTDKTSGYGVLTTKGTWITALNFDKYSFSFFADAAGKVSYSLTLIVAVIALVRYSRRPTLGPRDRKILSSLVATISWATLFFITDLSLLSWVVTPFWIVYGGIPITLWLNFHRSPKWLLIRSFLVVLYLPMIVFSYFLLIFPVSERVLGYLLLFFGSQLLWLGLTQIAAEASKGLQPESAGAESELVLSP